LFETPLDECIPGNLPALFNFTRCKKPCRVTVVQFEQEFDPFCFAWERLQAVGVLILKISLKKAKLVNLPLKPLDCFQGFTTRNTFFAAFKKSKGISPGAYANRNNKPDLN